MPAIPVLHPQRLYRTREVAAITGLSQSKIKQLTLSGRLRTVRIDSAVRVPASELDRLIGEGIGEK